MVTIGIIARSFHILPSEVRDRATAYDLMIMDVMTTWDEFKQNPAKANFHSEGLQEMIKQARQ